MRFQLKSSLSVGRHACRQQSSKRIDSYKLNWWEGCISIYSTSLNTTLSSQVCCRRKTHCLLQVLSHSGFVISCQHLELEGVIGSYAALYSLKLTVWELDLRRVLQRDWEGNITFTSAFKLSKPPPTCAGSWEVDDGRLTSSFSHLSA